jgi:hypothetical protein
MYYVRLGPFELSSCKHTVGVYNYRVWKTGFSLRSAVRSDLWLTGLLDIYNATERVQRTFNPILEELSTDMYYPKCKGCRRYKLEGLRKLSNYTRASTALGGGNSECMLVWTKGKIGLFC